MRRLAHSVLFLQLILIAWPAAAKPPEPVIREIAKKHYELGEQLYQISDYKKALEEFTKAYELEPMAEFLFNIARCHEVMANLEESIKYYQLYLEKKPDASNRGLVEARVANLKERLDERAKEKQSLPKAEAPASLPVDQKISGSTVSSESGAKPAGPSKVRWITITGWTAVAVGAAALGTGIAFGVLAKKKSDEYSDGVIAGKTYEELNDIDEAGKKYNKISIATLVVGGVLAAGGSGLLIWDFIKNRERPSPEKTQSRLFFAPFASYNSWMLSGGARF